MIPSELFLNNPSTSYRKQSLLSNGRQTRGNLFLLENDHIDKIEEVIRIAIENYAKGFKNHNEGFIKKWPNDYFLNGWLISMNSGGELKPHMHENGWISGSIYLSVPNDIEFNAGSLVLSLEAPAILKNTENTQKIFNVRAGDLCLFPSSLLHYTTPFESDKNRVVLAFDVIPK